MARLLEDLNAARKSAGYGEPMPALEAAAVVAAAEDYVRAVEQRVGGGAAHDR